MRLKITFYPVYRRGVCIAPVWSPIVFASTCPILLLAQSRSMGHLAEIAHQEEEGWPLWERDTDESKAEVLLELSLPCAADELAFVTQGVGSGFLVRVHASTHRERLRQAVATGPGQPAS